jgi:hypothetical protein
MVAITLSQFVVFALAPPPIEGGAAEWFSYFDRNALVGLLGFELLLALYAVLSVPLSVALVVALRRANQSLLAIFLALGIIGAVAFVAARPALEMLYLSNQYATASAEAERAAFLAAGEGLVAVFHGTAFYTSYILGSITGLVISIAMMRSQVFGRPTAYLRIASSVFDFGLFIPTVGLAISLVSVVCLMAFHLLVARRLLQFARKGTVHSADPLNG